MSLTPCRQKGLAPDLSSFLWKMLLDLLCTQQRLNRIGASPSDLCKLCTTEIGTLEHELIICSHNANTGYKLVTCLQTYIPTITAKTPSGTCQPGSQYAAASDDTSSSYPGQYLEVKNHQL